MNMDKYGTVKCGLVGGMKDLPVNQYIWDSVESVVYPDRELLKRHIMKVMPENVDTVVVYVTDMIPCLLALVDWCFDNQVTLITEQYKLAEDDEGYVYDDYDYNIELCFDTCKCCNQRKISRLTYCPHCGST